MLKVKIINSFLKKYRFFVAIAIVVLGGLFLPHIPYISMFTKSSMSFLLWISVIIAIGLKGKTLINIGIASFLILLLLTLFNKNDIAEQIGNATYLTLLTGVILLIVDTLKIRNKII